MKDKRNQYRVRPVHSTFSGIVYYVSEYKKVGFFQDWKYCNIPSLNEPVFDTHQEAIDRCFAHANFDFTPPELKITYLGKLP